jgi:hypothetical protein
MPFLVFSSLSHLPESIVRKCDIFAAVVGVNTGQIDLSYLKTDEQGKLFF